MDAITTTTATPAAAASSLPAATTHAAQSAPPAAESRPPSARLIVGSTDAITDILSEVRAARHTVEVAMFALRPSGTGMQLAEALQERARAGVDVKVHIEAAGSYKFPLLWPGKEHRKMVRDLRAAGADVVVQHRTKPLNRPPAWSAIDHRKLVVVDGQVAYTGGINLAGQFDAWHDVMVRLEGAPATGAHEHFRDRWANVGGAAYDRPNAIADAADGAAGIRLAANTPGRELAATEAIYSAIAGARKRVWVQSPVFTSPELARALGAAARRGVDVRVALPGANEWSASRYTRAASKMFWKDLAQAGVRIFEQPQMSHAKIVLADNQAIVGSVNATRRAELFDHELAVVDAHDGALTAQVSALFEADFARVTELTPKQTLSFGARLRDIVRDVLGLGY